MTTHELAAPKPWKILIVDDEEPIQRTLRAMLARAFPDAHIAAASSGPDGLTELGRTEFDLIISDFRMPNMDGVSFLTEARQLQPSSMRILLTGFADVEVAVRAVNEGHIHAFHTKPAKTEDLLTDVTRLLHENRTTKQRHAAFARSLDAAARANRRPEP